MKKLFILAALSLLTIGIQAQIDSYVVDASKVYENNTRTSYLTLYGNWDTKIAEIIQQEVIARPGVKEFSFYDASDLAKCMFISETSVDENAIVGIINEVIASFETEGENQDIRVFGNSFYENEVYRVVFTLDGVQDHQVITEIYKAFKNDDDISDVNFNNDAWELFSPNQLSPCDIESLVKDWGLTISEESIKLSSK